MNYLPPACLIAATLTVEVLETPLALVDEHNACLVTSVRGARLLMVRLGLTCDRGKAATIHFQL